jgi:hypothetical protein
VAIICGVQHVLRFWIYKWNARCAISGRLFPEHTTFDVALGKSFREKYSIAVNALDVGNRRVLLDNSLTFGGFHYNDPREIYVEFRYRFHY